MKTSLRVFFYFLLLLMTLGEQGMAQTFTDPAAKDPGYSARKRLARQTANRSLTTDNSKRNAVMAAARLVVPTDTVGCLFPVIPGFTALPRSDDGSYGPLALPFTFNLYGKSYNQVWINNNGSLTFNGPYSAYTAGGFPINDQPMVAAFWGDVDTRDAASGQVHYMITSTAMLVTWDHVGYHDGGVDKTNTFQIMIGTKESPYIGYDANIKFAYNDMQWATAGGFGGNPSTVGVNGGDGIHYFQVGRFAEDGFAYDGPGGNNDGINYLDHKCFSFDGTFQQNMPPTAVGLPLGNFVDINVGDTANLEVQFIAPEVGQAVSVTVDTQSVCKVDYAITNGAVAKLKLQIIGDSCNAGFHFIKLVATDNGTPQQSTTIYLIVNVNIEMQDQEITFPPPVDENGDGHMALKATASSGLPVVYFVEAGSAYIIGDSLIAEGGGEITIRAIQFGNSFYRPAEKNVTICVPAAKQPGVITGDAEACLNTESSYYVHDFISTNLEWSLSGGGTLTTDDNKATIKWNAEGTHTISVRYVSACSTPGPVRTFTVRVTHNMLNGSFSNLLPADGNNGIDLPITFSWSPIVNAKEYELYLWADTATRPETPFIDHITGINYTLFYDDILQYGKQFKWQVVAKNICYTLESPVQTFTFRKLPDLVVTGIQAPATGFSGQSFSVRWEVKNTGLGATLAEHWLDRIYLSTDKILDSADIELGAVVNMSALNPSGSYVNTVSFTLPEGISNKFYVIAETNSRSALNEVDKTNNTYISATTSSIQLTPPPDLRVTSVVPPTIAFSGQPISIKWTVANAGAGPVVGGAWSDHLYLSRLEQLDVDSAVSLGSFIQSGLLKEGTDYTKTATVRIPDDLFGKYYLYVRTDVYNSVYEHAAEGNNTGRSDSINIVLAPPVDLVVSRVTIPATASNGESIGVSWRVENAGASSTEGKGWMDRVYLSKTAVLNELEARLLGTFQRPLSLGQGEGYNMVRNFTIPAGITGNYYLHVKTDAEDLIFEYDYENNNIGVSAQPLNIITPDLVVAQITAPASAASGKAITVDWTVKNNGTGKVYNTIVKDRILLSAGATFHEANSKVLKEVVYQTGELPAGEDTVKQATVTLPEGISGNYYIYVQTDSANAVYETDNNNNVLRSTAAVAVTLSPWADLQVTGVQIADTAAAAEQLSVSYTGINKGNTATDIAWKDRIYLSLKPQRDTAGSILLREVPQLRSLGKDSSYLVNTTVPLPGEGGDTTYYIYVFVNAGKDVYEHTDSVNNVRRSNSLYIKKYPPVDLMVTGITAPVAANSGTPINIKWSVRNQGQAVTLPGQWSDGLYLSTDTVWDSGDRFVKAFTHQGTLAVGAAYTDEREFVIPNGVSGSYYLLLVTDRNNVNHDADTTNNYRLVRQGNDGNNGPAPINITLTPPADLVVTSLNVPDEGIAGQPVNIKWTVKNAGTGITAATGWTDKMYLSDNLEVDTADQVVRAYIRIGALAPGASYTDSLQVFLPNSITGNYILIFKTDANDNVYEHGAEENTSTHLIHVTKAPLTDLIVTDITIPDTVVAGEPVTIQWKLKNTGINPVSGYMQEGIYLSQDTTKDVNDIVAGLPDAYFNIPPQIIISRSFTTELSGLSLQDYHVLIQTDIRNNIAETSDDNNSAVSDKTMKVIVEELPLQVLKQRTLPPKRDIYYRIEIPDSLAGQSLLVTLKGDSVHGNNEMYLRFGDAPTRAVYDFGSTEPFSGNQEIVVPALKTGTYYLMVNGSTPYTSRQPISLLAGILHFEVRSVEAAKGGNTGLVTIQVKGSKLGTVTKLRLRKGGQVIVADKISITNPVSLFARFNLQGAPLDVYDVVAENSEGDTAVLRDGFTIEAGNANGLQTNVVAPPSTRPSGTIILRVQFTNTGNTDIINPVLKLTSLGGAPIAFEPSELANNAKVLTLKLKELNGPSGILRPGASGTIIVYAKATTALGFMLMQNNP
jgi:subtilase family serine protease